MEKRKIIFIAPEFYDYHKIITEKLRELFGETFFFPERKTNGLYTLLNNINPKLINLYQKIYFFFIWQQVKKEEKRKLKRKRGMAPIDEVHLTQLIKLESGKEVYERIMLRI